MALEKSAVHSKLEDRFYTLPNFLHKLVLDRRIKQKHVTDVMFGQRCSHDVL